MLLAGLQSVSVSVVLVSPGDAPLPSFVAVTTLFSAASAVALASCVLPLAAVVSHGSVFAFCSETSVPLSNHVTSFLYSHNNLQTHTSTVRNFKVTQFCQPFDWP